MQRRSFFTTTLGGASALALGANQNEPAGGKGGREYYELRRYHIESGPQQKLLNKYVADALIPGLNRLGMKTVGAFDLYLGPETPTLYVLIPATSLEDLVTAELKLTQDEEYLKAGHDFLSAPAREPAYRRIESSLMIAFEGHPKLTVPPVTAQHGARVFQLRTYESPSNAAHHLKVEMFHSGEFAIFEKAGFWPVFYGDTLVGERLPNLTYMLSFPDLTELDAKWKAFGSDPDWKKLSSSAKFSSEAIVSNISNLILRPTPYSQI